MPTTVTVVLIFNEDLALATSRCAALERGVALTADAPAQLEHTRALVDLGAALRRANRRADARRPLRHALDLAERGGMHLTHAYQQLDITTRHELAPRFAHDDHHDTTLTAASHTLTR